MSRGDAGHVPIAIVGGRLRRDRAGDQAARGRDHRLHDPRARRRAGRHVARQHLPRRAPATWPPASTRTRSRRTRIGRGRSAARRRSSTTCARSPSEHDVERDIRYDTELLDARWDDDAGRWALRHIAGPMTADVVIPATGPFGDPVTPDIPGLDRFEGTKFHSHALGPRPRPHRRAGRGDRHRRLGGPVHSRDPAAASAGCSSSSAPRRGSCRASTGPTSSSSARCYRRFPGVQRAIRGITYALVEGLGFVIFVEPALSAPFHARSAGGSCAARCPTRSCGASSPPTTRSAASGRSSATPTCRR